MEHVPINTIYSIMILESATIHFGYGAMRSCSILQDGGHEKS